MIKLALLYGGFSAEREISIKTGKRIAESLDNEKYQVFLFDLKDNFEEFIDGLKEKKFDLVFPALHGPFGEDGSVQSLIESFNIPYAFSGVAASFVAMDKNLTKKFLAKENILMSKHIILEKIDEAKIKTIKYPAVIKPVDDGSSISVSIVKDEKELIAAVEKILESRLKVMVEEFIAGPEVTAAVIGNNDPEALPLIEIRPKSAEFFDFEAKYQPGGSEEICPAEISPEMTKEIQRTAIKIHKALGCRGVTRSDFIINGGKPYFLEINTIPGMTETSLVPLAASKAGISFVQLLDRIIELALEK